MLTTRLSKSSKVEVVVFKRHRVGNKSGERFDPSFVTAFVTFG